MALSGPEALKSLDNAIADIRQEEIRIAKFLARSTEVTAKLSETKAALIRQLATIRLDETARKELSDQLFTAQNRAHKVLENHDISLNKAERLLKNLDLKISQNVSLRRKQLNEIDKAQLELKALSKKIAKEISDDPNYSQLKKEIRSLEEVAKHAKAKTELAKSDKEEKGKPYRSDPLFIYLWDKKFGTKSYKGSNLILWLDKKVAKLVGYNQARPNFAMLNEIPLRLNEHAIHQDLLLQNAIDKIDELEGKAIDKAGGAPFRQAITKAQASLSKIDKILLDLENQRDEQAEAYRLLALGQEPAFEKAKDMLVKSLNGQNILSMMRMAQITSTNEDNILVEKIEDITSRILEEEPKNKQHHDRLEILLTRRRELEDIEWEFKKARFDDPRSTFKKDNLTGSLLTEFLAGAISAAVYWNQFQGSQSWRSGSSDWGLNIGLPRSARRPKSSRGSSSPWAQSSRSGFSRPKSSSRSSPRPRSSSRGSRKSGGFKTGGGF